MARVDNTYDIEEFNDVEGEMQENVYSDTSSQLLLLLLLTFARFDQIIFIIKYCFLNILKYCFLHSTH